MDIRVYVYGILIVGGDTITIVVGGFGKPEGEFQTTGLLQRDTDAIWKGVRRAFRK